MLKKDYSLGMNKHVCVKAQRVHFASYILRDIEGKVRSKFNRKSIFISIFFI